MPKREPRVLIVESDVAELRNLTSVLESEGAFEIETATNGPQALALAEALKPDLIFCDLALGEMSGIDVCKAIRGKAGLSQTLFVLVTTSVLASVKLEALEAGVDDIMTKPLGVAELLAKSRGAVRIKTLHDELRDDKAELELLHRATSESFDQIVEVLSHLIDLRTPGAADRTKRLVETLTDVAERMELPEGDLDDLLLAARVYEIGKLVDGEAHHGGVVSATSNEDRHYAVLSSAILERVAQLSRAARIVHHLYENYDGTGGPGRLRQTEIPFRSRILRVVVDFFSYLDRRGTAVAVERLESKSGTWYDPVAVAQIAAMAHGGEGTDSWRAAGVRVPISVLMPGMTLAEDLVTDMGMKLVSAGAVLTTATLEFIAKRHEQEPFVRGAVIVPLPGPPSLFPASG